MKRLLPLLLILALTGVSRAAPDEVDQWLEKGGLMSVSTSYFALYQNLYPESASRMGFEGVSGRLDERSLSADAERRRFFNKAKLQLNTIKYKNLNPREKTDYRLLQKHIKSSLYDLSKQRYKTSPSYYADSIDSIYDLLLKRWPRRTTQMTDISDRLYGLKNVFDEGRNSLDKTSAADVEAAKRKIFNFYTHTDDVQNFFDKKAPMASATAELPYLLLDKKQEMRAFFDFLDTLPVEKRATGHAVGRKEYQRLLEDVYITDRTVAQASKTAETDVAKYKKVLLNVMGAITKEKTVSTAGFWNLASNYSETPAYQNILSQLALEVQGANRAMQKTLPGAAMSVNINHMPEYTHAYHQAFYFISPYGVEDVLTGNLFVYTPQNPFAPESKAFLSRHYNHARLKVAAAEYVVPGRQMFYTYSNKTSAVRRALGTDVLPEAWGMFARQLAVKNGFLSGPWEQLFVAWDDYTAALKAYADVKFHKRELSYEETLLLLVAYDIPKEDAVFYMQEIIDRPGFNVAVMQAYAKIKELYSVYRNKYGAKFNEADFVSKLLSSGKVPSEFLEAELEYTYSPKEMSSTLKWVF